MPPRRLKKSSVETPNKTIDCYFKPINTKRKIENNENYQEKPRPSPSPPQLKLASKENNSKVLSEKIFGEKILIEKKCLKSDRENIGSKLYERKDRENKGCKTFGTTNALLWQKFDRQPLREKPIKPVNTLKMLPSTSKPIQSEFKVLSDKDIEKGIESSIDVEKKLNDSDEQDELNTQFIEEISTLDSNYTDISSPLHVSYPNESDTEEEESISLDTFDVYQDDDDGDSFKVYVDKDDDDDDNDKFEVYVDKGNDVDDEFKVYVDKDNEDKFEVYVDKDNQDKFEVYVDKEDKNEAYVDKEDKNEAYVDKEDKNEAYVDNSKPSVKFKVYVDPEFRPNNVNNEDKESNNQENELPKDQIIKKDTFSLPDFFNDEENKEESSPTSGSKGFFDDDDDDQEEDYNGSIEFFNPDDFSISNDNFTPEFKEPIAPIFTTKYKKLKEKEQNS